MGQPVQQTDNDEQFYYSSESCSGSTSLMQSVGTMFILILHVHEYAFRGLRSGILSAAKLSQHCILLESTGYLNSQW